MVVISVASVASVLLAGTNRGAAGNCYRFDGGYATRPPLDLEATALKSIHAIRRSGIIRIAIVSNGNYAGCTGPFASISRDMFDGNANNFAGSMGTYTDQIAYFEKVNAC